MDRLLEVVRRMNMLPHRRQFDADLESRCACTSSCVANNSSNPELHSMISRPQLAADSVTPLT
jgi:hypothetical protein